jgi:biopolymer transport protein ExbD
MPCALPWKFRKNIRAVAMKLSHLRRTGHRPELMMTSMIDVVFLLLIYFMTTTATWLPEQELDSAIKVERTGGQSAEQDVRPLIIDVVPTDSGFGYRVGLREISTLDELRELVRQYPNKTAGAFVRVDDRVPFGLAAKAIHVCRDADYLPVSYIPLQEP